jgi:hypothetical protein
VIYRTKPGVIQTILQNILPTAHLYAIMGIYITQNPLKTHTKCAVLGHSIFEKSDSGGIAVFDSLKTLLKSKPGHASASGIRTSRVYEG